jgi:hypothetical protein
MVAHKEKLWRIKSIVSGANAGGVGIVCPKSPRVSIPNTSFKLSPFDATIATTNKTSDSGRIRIVGYFFSS